MEKKKTLHFKLVSMLFRITFDHKFVYKLQFILYSIIYLFVMKMSKKRQDILGELPTNNNTASSSNYASVGQLSALHVKI